MTEPTASTIEVEVAYAERDRQTLRRLRMPAGSTVGQAIEASGILNAIPLESAAGPIGIFGRMVEPQDRLRDGDRVEIYRPLLLDPKEARRRRARKRTGR